MDGPGFVVVEPDENLRAVDLGEPDPRIDILDMIMKIALLPPSAGTAEMYDEIDVLEELRAAVAERQAAVVVVYDTARRAEQATAGVPRSRIGQGIPEEIGLARRMSPGAAAVQLGQAKAWHTRLPLALAQLRIGRATEPQLTLLAMMADLFIHRLTGQAEAHLVPVEIHLTMDPDTLLAGGNRPGFLESFGPVTAEHARTIAAGDPPADAEPGTKLWAGGHRATAPPDHDGTRPGPPRPATRNSVRPAG